MVESVLGAGLVFASLGAVGGAELMQRIEWEAGDGCPSQAAVVAATTEYLGRNLAQFPRAVLAQARIEAAQGGHRLRLTIEVDGVVERHEVSGIDCDQLGRDAALLIAGAVDPFALGPRPPTKRQLMVTPVVVQRPRPRVPEVNEQRPPSQEPAPVEPAPVEPAPAIAELEPVTAEDLPKRAHARERARLVAGSLGLAATTFVGLFPQVGGGVELDAGIERGLFRWEISAAAWFGGSFRAPGTDVGGDLWAASAATGPCVVPSVRRVRFASCAVVGAGAITAISLNTTGPDTLARPWAYAGADLRVTWSPRPRAGLFVGLAVLPALARPVWFVSSPDTRYRIPPVTGLLRFGVELRRLGEAR